MSAEIFFAIVGAIILLMLSGLFSGLTLGLLGLDLVSLQIVAKGDTPNAKYADMVIPIRKKGNLLLCTLLLGNVAVNSALSILLAKFTNGVVGFALSTAFIVIFGEIIPQAACSRYALYIGSKVIHIVRVLIFLIGPLAYPISKVLDQILGDELGLVYTNRELRDLVELHTTQGDLPTESAGIMQGALDFSKLTVESVMTEWKSVFFLRSDAKLDFEKLERIFKSGHSRVPVVEVSRSPHGGLQQQVIGLLFVKDLILLDPEDELPVRNIIDTFRHDLKHIDNNTSVKTVMDEFRHGRSHLAIVRKQIAGKVNGEAIFENVGIVTLEDIIENILHMEIEDEFDFEKATADDKGRKDEILQLFDYRRTRGMDGMPPQEKTVVYRHLCREVEVFMPQHRIVDDVDLQNLLLSGRVHKVVNDNWYDKDTWETNGNDNMIEDGGYVLYKQGVQSEFFTFILDGKAEIYSGKQKFRSEVARFTILFPEMLSQTQNDHVKGLEFSAKVPDFTCRVIQNSRILRISRDNFKKCLEGKLRNYQQPYKETRQKIREIMQRPAHQQRQTPSEVSSLLPCSSFKELNFPSSIHQPAASEANMKMRSFSTYSQRSLVGGGYDFSPAISRNNDEQIRRAETERLLITGSRNTTPAIPRSRSLFRQNTMIVKTSKITVDPVVDDCVLVTKSDSAEVSNNEGEPLLEMQGSEKKDSSETSPLIAE